MNPELEPQETKYTSKLADIVTILGFVCGNNIVECLAKLCSLVVVISSLVLPYYELLIHVVLLFVVLDLALIYYSLNKQYVSIQQYNSLKLDRDSKQEEYSVLREKFYYLCVIRSQCESLKRAEHNIVTDHMVRKSAYVMESHKVESIFDNKCNICITQHLTSKLNEEREEALRRKPPEQSVKVLIEIESASENAQLIDELQKKLQDEQIQSLVIERTIDNQDVWFNYYFDKNAVVIIVIDTQTSSREWLDLILRTYRSEIQGGKNDIGINKKVSFLICSPKRKQKKPEDEISSRVDVTWKTIAEFNPKRLSECLQIITHRIDKINGDNNT
jgi:disulfide oxidoreductase YuzD